ncbi:MAG: cysteine desulfurase family protein [Candidatus Xenobia bacterium]
MRIYLDYAATTPMAPEVRAAMEPWLGVRFGNPSSVHGFGRSARMAVEQAREQVAGLLGATPSEIVFTGSGTEADNLALVGGVLGREKPRRRVLASAVEHHAVLHAGKLLQRLGFDFDTVPVSADGRPDVDWPVGSETALVACMRVNNETGVVLPVERLSPRCREWEVLLHCDAVQAAGSLPLDVSALGVDLLSLSAHKIYGPQGIGALYVRRGVLLAPLAVGGGQENGRRAGTENVASIVGFGVAADLARRRLPERQAHLARLEAHFQLPMAERVGSPPRVPGIQSWRFPGVDGEALLCRLDVEGIAASMGAACSSGALSASHVMLAMGYAPEAAREVIRFSFGEATTTPELDRLMAVLQDVVPRCRR